MTRAEAFDMMRLLLSELLDDAQKLSTQAKNSAARRAAQNRVTRIRDALNAADEVAVAAFLAGNIQFDQIPRIIEDVLAATNSGKLESISRVLEADAEARRLAKERVARKKIERSRATSFV